MLSSGGDVTTVPMSSQLQSYLSKVKPVNFLAQMGKASRVLPLAEVLLTTESYWGRESHFPLRVCDKLLMF